MSSIQIFEVFQYFYGMDRQCWPIGQNYGKCSVINHTFVIRWKNLVVAHFYFSSVFLCFSLVTISWEPHMTTVSFVKTMESYNISLFLSKWQTPYDSGIIREGYGMIRGLLMDYPSFFDRVTIWVVYSRERTETGGPHYRIGSYCAGVHSCNSLFFFSLVF